MKLHNFSLRTTFCLSAIILVISSTEGQNVGIGVPIPSQKLDIAGNLQFSGALMPASNAGTSGYLLQSQGAGLAPAWVGLASGLVETYSYISSATITSAPGSISYLTLTGCSHTVTVPAGKTYKVYVSAYGNSQKSSSASQDVMVQYALFLNGAVSSFLQRNRVDDEGLYFDSEPWAISGIFTLSGGTHTIDVRGTNAGSSGPDIWLCTPSGFVGMAIMSLVIIKE